MSFLDRLQTLFRADAHGVVDALEDPALLLRQHLRDAAAELDRKRARITGLDAEERDLEAERRRLADEIRVLDGDVALGLGSGREDLARFSLKRLLPLRRRDRRIETRLGELRRERDELRPLLAEQETAYAELERRIRGHLARLDQEAAGLSPLLFDDPIVTDEEVELEMLRRRGPEPVPVADLGDALPAEGGA